MAESEFITGILCNGIIHHFIIFRIVQSAFITVILFMVLSSHDSPDMQKKTLSFLLYV